MPLTGCDAVRRSEEKYRLLFHSTPIALIERDASRLKIYLDRLRESGVSDFEEYLRDNLIGLYNRRYLYNSLSGLIEVSKAMQTSLSVIFMDLDNFKKVVDVYGHLNGSCAIQEVARTIQETLTSPAYAVAYAGDEFVIVLPEFNQFQAAEKASNLQFRIKSTVYLQDYGHEVKLQASYGVAAFPDHATDLTGLLASADRSLFSIKETGKGSVGIADLWRA